MNSNDFDSWNREAIISRALEYRETAERYRRKLIDVEVALTNVAAERDRLRNALEDISAEGRHARSGSTAYRMAVIARKALQEAGE